MAERYSDLIRRLEPQAEFSAPVLLVALSAAEERLGCRLPASLKDMLRESDGVLGGYGLGLVWPLSRIVGDNLLYRSNADFPALYMPFDHLLFFADAGNGDQFAFPIPAGEVQPSKVFAWNHENDSRTWVAGGLRQYLDWWLTGRITL